MDTLLPASVRHSPPGGGAGPVAALPQLTADLVGDLERRALDLLLAQIDLLLGPADPVQGQADLVLGPADARLLSGPGTAGGMDGSVYAGSAGIGLELLHHRHRPGVPEALGRLAGHAAAATHRADLPPGLFTGAAGGALFLARLEAAGQPVPPAAPALDDGLDPGDDAMGGLAGRGLAELLRYDVDGDPARLATARSLARRVLSRSQPKWTVSASGGPPPAAGADPAFGYAHGLAGVVDFLVAAAARTGDLAIEAAAYLYARRLARQAGERAAVAAGPAATAVAAGPAATAMAAGWCRGLAGAARALQHAATYLEDPELQRAALRAAGGCAGWVPRLADLGQCCGAAGVGSALVEVAVGSGDERMWDAAHRTARHLLERGFLERGFPERGLGPAGHLTGQRDRIGQRGLGPGARLSWGTGYAGVLAFLRRLHRPETPDLLAGPAARKDP